MRILILNKTHLGAGTYDCQVVFKYTKNADGLFETNQIDGTNDPHIHQHVYRATIDLAVQDTPAKRKAALLAALTPIALQYRNQTVAARALEAAAAQASADFVVDLPTDNGFNAGNTV